MLGIKLNSKTGGVRISVSDLLRKLRKTAKNVRKRLALWKRMKISPINRQQER